MSSPTAADGDDGAGISARNPPAVVAPAVSGDVCCGQSATSTQDGRDGRAESVVCTPQSSFDDSGHAPVHHTAASSPAALRPTSLTSSKPPTSFCSVINEATPGVHTTCNSVDCGRDGCGGAVSHDDARVEADAGALLGECAKDGAGTVTLTSADGTRVKFARAPPTKPSLLAAAAPSHESENAAAAADQVAEGLSLRAVAVHL